MQKIHFSEIQLITKSIKAQQSIVSKAKSKRIIQQKQHRLTINMIKMPQKCPKQARRSLNRLNQWANLSINFKYL